MEDHELLVRIDERINVIHDNLSAIKKDCDDHECRIKDLEDFRAKVIGIAILLGTVGSIIGNIIARVIGLR